MPVVHLVLLPFLLYVHVLYSRRILSLVAKNQSIKGRKSFFFLFVDYFVFPIKTIVPIGKLC